MSNVRWLVVLVAAFFLTAALPESAGAQAGCTFKLGFKALRDLIPDVVGTCLEDEHFNLANGNAEQRTTGGLLVWRKADNWTAFTDGATTYLMGPEGLVSRPNEGPLFSWEAPAPPPSGSPPPPPLPPSPPPSPAPAPAPAAPQADPWLGDIAFGYDQSGNGATPSGGSVPLVDGVTLWGFVSWRNIAPGTPIQIQVLWGKIKNRTLDWSPSIPQGRTRVAIVRFEQSRGGGHFAYTDFSMVFFIDGKEVARGWIQVG